MEEQRLSKKVFNICIVVVLIILILFVAIMFILHYNEKGETNMPFQVSKISIISTVDGQNVENSEYKWAINVIQNNDINIYIEKNENYSKQETISSVALNEFSIKSVNNSEDIKIYKPVDSDLVLFQNTNENEVKELNFEGAKATDTKKMLISNQGGRLTFRCANNNIGQFLSNDGEEIKYNELLKKMNINEENLNAKISFNIIIKLDSGKTFKAENVEIEIPNKNIVELGSVGIENTDLNDIVFKRIEN